MLASLTRPPALALLLACAVALAPVAGQDVPEPAPLPLASEFGVTFVAPEAVVLGEWFELVATGPLTLDASMGFVDQPADVLARRGRTRPAADDQGTELSLSLVAARPGPLVLEGLIIKDGEIVLAVTPLELEVLFDIAPEATPRVADPKDPLGLPLPPAPTWIFATAIVALLALVATWIVRQGREVPIVLHTVPADQQAMAALERMRLDLPRTSDEVAVFMVRACDVLRDYIEARFLVHAPAQTTEEFLIEAVREPALAERRETLDHFLTLCDLVKYARLRPAPSEAEGLLDTAAEFVEQTR
jgi:hypothetical protein